MLKNKYIRNSLIILVITTLLLATDLLLKHYLYDANFEAANKPYGTGEASVRQWDITVIAGRSLLHDSSTFLDFVHWSIPRWASLLINYLIAALFITMGLMSKTKGVVIGSAIVLAGIFGNALDSTFHNGVRDIFFLPWWDRGTFNFADCIVVAGAGVTAISFLVMAIKPDPKESKKAKIK